MGHVKANPQVGMDGQPSGNTMLEITYGGHESPFGGLDTSAPPAYIDPKCFASSEGFLVVDNKLIVATLSQGAFPVLWNGVQVTPLKFGTYYDSKYGQLNYALGCNVTTPVGPPLYFLYNYYITTWDTSNNIIDNKTLAVRLWQGFINPVAATLTLPLIVGEDPAFTDSGNVGIEYGIGGVVGGNVSVSYIPGNTLALIINALAVAITAASGATGFTAAATPDGYSLVFTAVTPGAAGNNLCLWDFSGSTTPGTSPAFYFPIGGSSGGGAATFLTNGADTVYTTPPVPLGDTSATAVAGTLYFANLGPLILKYSVTGGLNISTTYSGVKVIRKFAGSLIGLGVKPSLNLTVQNQDMIFSWSAANNLDEWNPVTSVGNVTGAGFAQLADIDDALNGLIVSNNTAFILRGQGISYATALSNASDPFQFAHIGLGNSGEGAQNTSLVAQYDQTGAFVGNTDVYQVSGSISPIGHKIATQLFKDLHTSTGPLGAEIYPCTIADSPYPLVIFMIGDNFYLYNTKNQSWMFSSATFDNVATLYLATLATVASPGDVQIDFTGTIVYYSSSPFYALTPYQLVEGMDGTTLSNLPQVTFPIEEIVFGRDVTIDALYIAVVGQITGTVTVTFLFNGNIFSVLTLSPFLFTNLNTNPIELQVFPTNTNGTGVFTARSPQLSIQVATVGPGTVTGLRFTKIQVFGSFDPAQRPV